MVNMTQHFSEIATLYNKLRITDHEPIDYIKEKLLRINNIQGVDIGCGSRRYNLVMLQKISDLYLTCADVNQSIPSSFDFISSFNAIHHSEIEFSHALSEFKENIQKHFPNPDKIEYLDQNVMLVFRKI